uniref:aromatase n=1 Tax=Paramormyrops kingsleyae TaxID=1676925 RepID=A0A3B3QSB0_9TELE
MALVLGSYTVASFIVTLLVAFVTYVMYQLLSRFMHKWKEMKPIPGLDQTYPILGNALYFKSSAGEFFCQLVQLTEQFKKEPLMKLWIGPVPFLVLFHAENVEMVLNNPKHMDKSYVYRFLHPWLGTGLLTSTGDKWRNRRKMLTPTFHFSILTEFLEVMNEQAEVLMGKLEKAAGQGPFNCFNHITLCALDIICETAMGKKIYAQSNQDSEYVRSVVYCEMSDIIIRRVRMPWYWPNFVYRLLGDGKEHDRSLKVLHSFTESVIREREEYISNNESDSESDEGSRKRRAFLDMLLKTTDEHGNKLTPKDIQEEVDTFMFEGHDTTAAAMNWAIHLLGSHPEVQRKVQQELQEVFGSSDRPVNMDDMKKLRYLECVIKESLRLFPSVPMFGRSICEDCTENGPTQAGEKLVAAGHREARRSPNPATAAAVFWPLHVCGQRFALMEEKVVLSYILRYFNIEAMQKREDLKPIGDLILRPEKGIWIRLTKRTR